MRSFLRLPLLALAVTLAACDGGSSDEGSSPGQALRLSALLPAPTADEVAAVRADWGRRSTAAAGVRTEKTGTLTLGTAPMRYTVVSHTVAGVRHVGVIVAPMGSVAVRPVLVYTHGAFSGEGGFPYFPVESMSARIPAALVGSFVYVIPSYRAERIQVGGVTYTSEGSPSIGDYDVDDTMALLSVALQQEPTADPARVAVFGESRGGLVALEMGIRDPRVRLVVDAFGLTDLRTGLGTVTEDVFQATLRAYLRAPTAPEHLLTRTIFPAGSISLGPDSTVRVTADGLRAARLTLARTTPVAFAASLPAVQVHHGTADMTAPISNSRNLRDALAAAGRAPGSATFEYFEYAGGDHDLGTLPGIFARMEATFRRLFAL